MQSEQKEGRILIGGCVESVRIAGRLFGKVNKIGKGNGKTPITRTVFVYK